MSSPTRTRRHWSEAGWQIRPLDLGKAFAKLKETNFRYRQDIMDALLAAASRGA
jgi:hypothetical protein